jgi:hypothetical protein
MNFLEKMRISRGKELKDSNIQHRRQDKIRFSKQK